MITHKTKHGTILLDDEGHVTHIGCFATLDEARQARIRAAAIHYGEFVPTV